MVAVTRKGKKNKNKGETVETADAESKPPAETKIKKTKIKKKKETAVAADAKSKPPGDILNPSVDDKLSIFH